MDILTFSVYFIYFNLICIYSKKKSYVFYLIKLKLLYLSSVVFAIGWSLLKLMGGFTQLLTSGHHEINRRVRKLARTPKILKKYIDKGSHFLLLHSKHVINTWMQKACSQMISGLRD